MFPEGRLSYYDNNGHTTLSRSGKDQNIIYLENPTVKKIYEFLKNIQEDEMIDSVKTLSPSKIKKTLLNLIG